VVFSWSSSVQTTCEFCRSILVRHDVDVERVGKVADLPPDVSPIQIRTEGIYKNKAFTVVGRILYEWEGGGWNEWHLMFQDGESGWLSDAQLEYFVSFRVDPGVELPTVDSLFRGRVYELAGQTYQVSTITRAGYVGVEGELPFEFWDKQISTFADLRSATSQFATIDYTEDPPILFAGQAVDFDALQLRNLREFEGW
jgi:hypothetical protein